MGDQKKVPNTWVAGYERTMKQAILLAGNGDITVAIRRLARQDVPVMDVAVALLGGVSEAHKLLGVPRSTFDNMRKRPLAEWKGQHSTKLAEETGIPLEMLFMTMEELAKLPLPEDAGAPQA